MGYMWGWWYPRQSSVVPPHFPPPSLHRHDGESASFPSVQPSLFVNHLRELSGGHPIHVWNGIHADEGFEPFIKHGPLNPLPCQRIRPIEHHKLDSILSGCLHSITHRRDVGV